MTSDRKYENKKLPQLINVANGLSSLLKNKLVLLFSMNASGMIHEKSIILN